MCKQRYRVPATSCARARSFTEVRLSSSRTCSCCADNCAHFGHTFNRVTAVFVHVDLFFGYTHHKKTKNLAPDWYILYTLSEGSSIVFAGAYAIDSYIVQFYALCMNLVWQAACNRHHHASYITMHRQAATIYGRPPSFLHSTLQ